jgi:hypothetical protein
LKINIFTQDEINLMSIYNTGTKDGLMNALAAMREYLEPEETELRDLTDSALDKLEHISDEEYEALELYPDFDE